MASGPLREDFSAPRKPRETDGMSIDDESDEEDGGGREAELGEGLVAHLEVGDLELDPGRLVCARGQE